MENDSKSSPRSSGRKYFIGGLIGVMVLGAGVWFVRNAFLKVQNNAIEKSCIGEARQISSAAQQYFSEHKCNAVMIADLALYFGSGSGSKEISTDGVNYYKGDYAKMPGVLQESGFFFVGHPNFSKSRSSNRWLIHADGGEHAIKFRVDSGQVAPEPPPAR